MVLGLLNVGMVNMDGEVFWYVLFLLPFYDHMHFDSNAHTPTFPRQEQFQDSRDLKSSKLQGKRSLVCWMLHSVEHTIHELAPMPVLLSFPTSLLPPMLPSLHLNRIRTFWVLVRRFQRRFRINIEPKPKPQGQGQSHPHPHPHSQTFIRRF